MGGIFETTSQPHGNPDSLGGTKPRRDLAILIFLTLWGTCAYFWQSRDWNTASRLMLTYALGDRGTLHIDGLEIHAGDPQHQAGDLAIDPDGHFYTEKAPGQSFTGLSVYMAWKWLVGSPGHPLNLPQARPFWPQDYWLTVFTSGLATAIIGVLIYRFSVRLGTSHGDGTLLSLTFGLGTYGLVYGTLFYGHQTAALCMLAAFYLTANPIPIIGEKERGTPARGRTLAAGLAAGWGIVVEMPMLVIAGLIGLEILRLRRQIRPALLYATAVAVGLIVLATYHTLAFGDPLTSGYHHVIDPLVRRVHQGVGLFGLNWSVLPEILWGVRRGLFVYAPVTLLGVAALGVMAWRQKWSLCLVPTGTLAALLLINASHFFWAGGLSTGPRFLLPAVPMLILPIAGWLATLRHDGRDNPHRRWMLWLVRYSVGGSAAVGTLLAMACTFAGGRFIPMNDRLSGEVAAINPLTQAVLPALDRGWKTGWPTRTVSGELWGVSPPLQVVILVAFLAGMLVLLLWRLQSRGSGAESATPVLSHTSKE